MAQIAFHKTNVLPAGTAASAVYFIPGSDGVVELIVTSKTGVTRQVAPVGSTVPNAIGAAGSAGTSDMRARADHTHALTAIPSATTATTQSAGDNSTKVATTAFVTTALATKANLADPTFTGTVSAPTPTAGDNTTKVATTAFVSTALSGKANLASPTFTGTPTAPTPALGDNTTKIATTAYVLAALNNTQLNWSTEEW